MSAVKRVRKQLDQGLRRQTAAPKNASIQSRIDSLQRQQQRHQQQRQQRQQQQVQGRGEREEEGGGSQQQQEQDQSTVTVTGTGRAVEKTLRVAAWFQQQGDCEVEIRTKTVGTVDDIVASSSSSSSGAGNGDHEVDDDENQFEEDESRVRRLSCLEVVVRLR